MLRAVPPPIRQSLSGSWIAYPAQSCCRSGGYDNPGTAFDHARDLNHLIKLKRAPYKQLRDVVRAISAARNVDQTPPIPHDLGEAAAACLTLGRADVGRLWQAGVHPRYVLETREALGLTGRMPASFYLAVVTRRPDLEWMRSTLEAAGPLELPTQVSPGGVVLDADGHMSLPEWLAHTQAAWDLADPTERGRWLSLGISRQVLLGLGGRGYSPEDIATLAEGMSRSADGAARYLVSWLVCDVRPRIGMRRLKRGCTAPSKSSRSSRRCPANSRSIDSRSRSCWPSAATCPTPLPPIAPGVPGATNPSPRSAPHDRHESRQLRGHS